MAQVCGDSSYDYFWDRQHDLALKLLCKAADLWASGGADRLSSDSLIAVLLNVYLFEPPEIGLRIWERRDLASWREFVTTARQELSNLRPNSDASVLDRLDAELSFAITQWMLGDPESPPAMHATNAIEHILFLSKLTRRPPNPKMPTSLFLQESPSSGR